MGFAVLFPGQGSQFVGMGADVFEARPDLLGKSADDILGWSLASLCSDGPERELTRTDRAQPALFAVAYALWEAFDAATTSSPQGAAGHSLGEYTALAAAGALDFATGLSLVAARGKAMQAAAERFPSGMAALIGADHELAEKIALLRREEGGELWVANINTPTQVVLSGRHTDIEWLIRSARDLGARRVIPLNVSSGFHSPLMDEAQAELAASLGVVSFRDPEFPVWANCSGEAPGNVADNLRSQLSNTVRFSDSLESMRTSGIDTFVHVGPGDVSAGMVRGTLADVRVFTVSSLDDVPDVAAAVALQ
jgi:[acyl-carrier-protein] S-malonyltransferase